MISYDEYEQLLAGQLPRRRRADRAEDMPDDLVADLDRAIADTEHRLAEAGDGPSAA